MVRRKGSRFGGGRARRRHRRGECGPLGGVDRAGLDEEAGGVRSGFGRFGPPELGDVDGAAVPHEEEVCLCDELLGGADDDYPEACLPSPRRVRGGGGLDGVGEADVADGADDGLGGVLAPLDELGQPVGAFAPPGVGGLAVSPAEVLAELSGEVLEAGDDALALGVALEGAGELGVGRVGVGEGDGGIELCDGVYAVGGRVQRFIGPPGGTARRSGTLRRCRQRGGRS